MLVDAVSVGAVATHTFTSVTGDHTIVASFAPKPAFMITATAGTGGSITPGGAVAVACGTDKAFTIAANSGYAIADVLVDGSSVGAAVSHTFTNVQAAHTIAAAFVDVAPPSISATTAAPGLVSAVVTWTTDEVATSRVDYGTVPDPLGSNESSAGLETSHSLTLTALAPATTYHYRVTSLDAAGHATTYPAPPAPPLTFTTLGPAADNVAPVPSGALITALYPCLTVPVVFTRDDATPVRGYSVVFELSANLTLCGAEIASADYPQEPRNFQVTAQAGNRWKVDEVTLGFPCGVTGSGTLFNVSVTSSETVGSGTITVVSALARDCSNVSVPVSAGLPADILIDKEAVVDVADGAVLSFALEGVRPNPTTAGRMAVSFVLPVGAPARLELVDVKGRMIATRDIGSLGAGRHVVDLAAGQELRAGIYLVRLTQGRLQRTARVVVLD